MEEQIRQIAERLKGLRDALDISADEVARSCGIETDQYLLCETGKFDIPVSILHKVAHHFGVDLTALLTGQEPHMRRYSVTRKGQGVNVERRNAYKYQSLAYNFINRKAEPFLVNVEPKTASESISLNAHSGQEFNYILSGRMKIILDGKEIILGEGDSIWFDSSLPHGMLAIDEKPCSFLAFIFN
jgi:mannose-6-phosphate isomerase-like protein (cupin superfamily)